MDVLLDKNYCGLGDELKGVIRLKLSEPVVATRLFIVLRAIRYRRVFEYTRTGDRVESVKEETIREIVTEVGGQKTYKSGEHSFTLKIPSSVLPEVTDDGFLTRSLHALQRVRSLTASHFQWQVQSFLEMAWEINVSKNIDIVISNRSDTESQEENRMIPHMGNTLLSV